MKVGSGWQDGGWLWMEKIYFGCKNITLISSDLCSNNKIHAHIIAKSITKKKQNSQKSQHANILNIISHRHLFKSIELPHTQTPSNKQIKSLNQ